MWMFYNWIEDQNENVEITKNHAYLIGSFIKPEAVKELINGGKGNHVESSDEAFEESIEMIKNNSINLGTNIASQDIPQKRRRRFLKD